MQPIADQPYAFEPSLWLRRGMAVAAALLAGVAVASVVVYYGSFLPRLPTFRERVLLYLLFASVIPIVSLVCAMQLGIRSDSPKAKSGTKQQRSTLRNRIETVVAPSVTGAVFLFFCAIWVSAVLNAIMLVLSFVFGSPVSLPAAG
jgi:hypothetical protein